MPYSKPDATQKQASKFNARDAHERIDCIIIHHTGGNTLEGTVNYFAGSAAKASAHYVIGREGTIVQMVPDEKRAWHAGESHLHGIETDVNGRSIGIELVNTGGPNDLYHPLQIESLARLVRYLVATYKVPAKNVLGHKDVCLPEGRKVDPSKNFPWDAFRFMVWGKVKPDPDSTVLIAIPKP